MALVLPWPYRRTALAMTWQAEAGLWYRMPGGYFIGPQRDSDLPRFDAIPSPASITFGQDLRRRPPPRLTGPRRRALARDFVRWRVGSVVVGPMPNQAAMVAFLTDLLGREPRLVEGVYLWRDPVVELGTGAGARPLPDLNHSSSTWATSRTRTPSPAPSAWRCLMASSSMTMQ